MDCPIYENLNYVPFTFYRLLTSQYYYNESNKWDFSVFEDKPVTENFDHLAVNYRQEMKRLEDAPFKAWVDHTLERLTREVKRIKKPKTIIWIKNGKLNM